MKGVVAREEEILAAREIDLQAIFGEAWAERAADTHRYYVKHALCRIEPTWLRFVEKGKGDPLWVRPMGMEPLWAGPNGRIGGRLNYGWLIFGWEFWGAGEPLHPFGERLLPTPIIATRSVEFEFALVPTTARSPQDDGDGLDLEWLERTTGGGPVAPEENLAGSPVGQAFIGGALDFEAGTRGLAPDRREPVIEDPVSEPGLELRRVGLLAAITRQVWATGSIDIAAVRAVRPSPDQLNPVAVRIATAPFEDLDPEGEWESVVGGLAEMSSLKLVEALELGPRTEAGGEALQEAARFAGCCASAHIGAGEPAPEVWDSVCAAAARIARLG